MGDKLKKDLKKQTITSDNKIQSWKKL